jgi:pyridoxal 5'-phosphate synthase pdxT subunit
MNVGVLAFQGDFAEHLSVLHQLHVHSVEVRSFEDLAKVDALIIPGGESTVITRFLADTGVGKEIVRRVKADMRSNMRSLSVYGTCAGAIVLSKKVTGKNLPSTLGLIDVTLERNAYGTQRESFEAKLKVKGLQDLVSCSFIRAPKIVQVGRGVEVLSEYGGVPVLVRQGRVLVGTFHPEVCGDVRVHELFIKITTE